MDDSQIRGRLDYLVQNNASLSKATRRKRKEELLSGFFGANHHEILFPVKLHKLASCNALFPNIYWLDNYTFAVNRKGFEKHIMTIFFRQCKFKSFLNMLSRYGFKSCSSPQNDTIPTRELIAYGHPFFQRDREDLCQNISPAIGETEAGPPHEFHCRVVDVSRLERPGVGNNNKINSSTFTDQGSCHQVHEALPGLDNTNSMNQDYIPASNPHEDIITNPNWTPPVMVDSASRYDSDSDLSMSTHSESSTTD